MNGYVKAILHGSNKIDIEIVNTLKICNAYKILKSSLNLMRESSKKKNVLVCGKELPRNTLDRDDADLIEDFCLNQDLDYTSIELYARVEIDNDIYTSSLYLKQKKRINFLIYWEDDEGEEKFGSILVYLSCQNRLFALVHEMLPYNNSQKLSNHNIRFPNYHHRVRLTYCKYIISIEKIRGKLIKIKDYVCHEPDYKGKK